jgi:hypothetical protein
MGCFEGFHRLRAGEAMVFKGNLLLLQQSHGAQAPWAGVLRKIHPVEPNST